MATDVVNVYNQALGQIGSKASVASLEEASPEVNTLNLYYADIRDRVLHMAPWPCAKASARLAVSAERDFTAAWTEAAPPPPWRFAYTNPADMLRPRHLYTFDRFTLGSNSSNENVIYTDVESAILFYIKRQTSPQLWDIQLTGAIVSALAFAICRPLTGKTNLAQQLLIEANTAALDARAAEANDDNDRYETMPDWYTARGFSTPTVERRYVYPFGPLLGNQNAS